MSHADVLFAYGAVISSPDELYTDLFKLGQGYSQKTGEYRPRNSTDFKGNLMIYVNDAVDYKGKMRRYILLEDTLLDQLHQAQQMPSNLINAVSYYGRKKDTEHSDRCFGLIFDIDEVDDSHLNAYLYGMRNDAYPCPNYVVTSKSGIGVHLYYVFDEPLRLFPKIKVQLKELKYSLISRMWNQYTSGDENVQFQSYDQSFMVAGTTENMKVYKFENRENWTIEELCEYSSVVFDRSELFEESKYSLEEAKEKFPEWYERVIVQGNKERGHWTCKRDLYDWWKRKMLDPEKGATYGHRYWCVMMLVIYAIKSGISYEEVEKDAYDLIPILNKLNPEKPFTEEDVSSALDCYDSQFATFPIDDISRLSNIRIDKNKRNWRTQKLHLKLARANRDILQADKGIENWYENSPHSGRKSKKDIVIEWRKSHIEGKPKDCIAETGLNKNTVYKWWEA